MTNISVPYCYISTKNAKKKQKKMKGAEMQHRFHNGISIMIIIHQWSVVQIQDFKTRAKYHRKQRMLEFCQLFDSNIILLSSLKRTRYNDVYKPEQTDWTGELLFRKADSMGPFEINLGIIKDIYQDKYIANDPVTFEQHQLICKNG